MVYWWGDILATVLSLEPVKSLVCRQTSFLLYLPVHLCYIRLQMLDTCDEVPE